LYCDSPAPQARVGDAAPKRLQCGQSAIRCVVNGRKAGVWFNGQMHAASQPGVHGRLNEDA